ncbi:hypothetical protein Sjap_026029 [Stephania japonica]|uniref:Uncharacterized protein n=1 Tax=Stephania japonica TaxID=461633 RepID=A0AAP0HEQ3_9MAGN
MVLTIILLIIKPPPDVTLLNSDLNSMITKSQSTLENPWFHRGLCRWNSDMYCKECPKGTLLTGSDNNDEFYTDDHGRIRTRTNRSGGIQFKSPDLGPNNLFNSLSALFKSPDLGIEQSSMRRPIKSLSVEKARWKSWGWNCLS